MIEFHGERTSSVGRRTQFSGIAEHFNQGDHGADRPQLVGLIAVADTGPASCPGQTTLRERVVVQRAVDLEHTVELLTLLRGGIESILVAMQHAASFLRLDRRAYHVGRQPRGAAHCLGLAPQTGQVGSPAQ